MQNFQKALEELAVKDKILAGIIKQARLRPIRPGKNFLESLTRSIVSQQLSTKAANTIYSRFLKVFKSVFPSPEAIIKMSDLKLRAAGLSFQKISYIKNLAMAVKEGSVDFKKIAIVEDERIIENLTQVKGIGRWTAEMFLIFSLNRSDVFSHGDLGLRNAIKKLYGVDAKRNKRKYEKVIENWKPYRSLAARLLWASLNF